jgi:hypothetical protein
LKLLELNYAGMDVYRRMPSYDGWE